MYEINRLRKDVAVECLENIVTVSGDRVLLGFTLNLSKVW